MKLVGEVALLAEGNDVVMKGLKVAVGYDGDSEGGVLAAVLGDAAELLTVPKKVMVCWVCMVFLLFAQSIGTHPKGREGALLTSCGMPRCQEKKFLERDPEPATGEESNTRRARYASSERRAEGRSSCTEAVAE